MWGAPFLENYLYYINNKLYMEFNLESDTKPLDYSQIYFRAIDRIQALSSKDYQNEKDKLFDFSWSVKMFKASIPNNKIDNVFKKEYKEWEAGTVSGFKQEFEHYLDLFNICINNLGRNGVLFKHVKSGSY